jgi:hypothetical protein
MKKSAIIACAVSVLFFVSPRELPAQMKMNLRAGIVMDKSFSLKPLYWTMGVDFDFRVVRALYLNPEIYMIVPDFDFDSISVAPGIMLNYILPNNDIWFGGGITKWEWWRLGPEVAASPSSGVALKLNVSIISAPLTLTVFVVTPFNNIFNDITLGLLLGI